MKSYTLPQQTEFTAIYAYAPAKIQNEGEAFVAAKLFSDVVKELPPEEICLSVKGSFLYVQSISGAKFQMKVPLVSGVSWTQPPELGGQKNRFTNPIKKVSVHVGTSLFLYCTRLSMKLCFCWIPAQKINHKTLCLVGTDGFRLSYCSIDFDMPEDF